MLAVPHYLRRSDDGAEKHGPHFLNCDAVLTCACGVQLAHHSSSRCCNDTRVSPTEIFAKPDVQVGGSTGETMRTKLGVATVVFCGLPLTPVIASQGPGTILGAAGPFERGLAAMIISAQVGFLIVGLFKYLYCLWKTPVDG